MAKLQHDVPCAAKDSHLIEWMNTVDPLACTTIMLQRCSREERGFYNCVVVLGWSRLKFSRLYTDIAVTLLFFQTGTAVPPLPRYGLATDRSHSSAPWPE